MSLNTDTVIAIADYKGTHDEQLTFYKGEELRILNREGQHWWWAELDGRCGYIPVNHTSAVKSQKQTKSVLYQDDEYFDNYGKLRKGASNVRNEPRRTSPQPVPHPQSMAVARKNSWSERATETIPSGRFVNSNAARTHGDRVGVPPSSGIGMQFLNTPPSVPSVPADPFALLNSMLQKNQMLQPNQQQQQSAQQQNIQQQQLQQQQLQEQQMHQRILQEQQLQQRKMQEQQRQQQQMQEQQQQLHIQQQQQQLLQQQQALQSVTPIGGMLSASSLLPGGQVNMEKILAIAKQQEEMQKQLQQLLQEQQQAQVQQQQQQQQAQLQQQQQQRLQQQQLQQQHLKQQQEQQRAEQLRQQQLSQQQTQKATPGDKLQEINQKLAFLQQQHQAHLAGNKVASPEMLQGLNQVLALLQQQQQELIDFQNQQQPSPTMAANLQQPGITRNLQSGTSTMQQPSSIMQKQMSNVQKPSINLLQSNLQQKTPASIQKSIEDPILKDWPDKFKTALDCYLTRNAIRPETGRPPSKAHESLVNQVKMRNSSGTLLAPAHFFSSLLNHVSLSDSRVVRLIMDQYDLAEKMGNVQWIAEARQLATPVFLQMWKEQFDPSMGVNIPGIKQTPFPQPTKLVATQANPQPRDGRFLANIQNKLTALGSSQTRPTASSNMRTPPVGLTHTQGKPVALSNMPTRPVGLTHTQGKPVALSNMPTRPVGLTHTQGKPVALSNMPTRPVGLNNAQNQPVYLTNIQSRPVGLSHSQSKPVTLSKMQPSPLITPPVSNKRPHDGFNENLQNVSKVAKTNQDFSPVAPTVYPAGSGIYRCPGKGCGVLVTNLQRHICETHMPDVYSHMFSVTSNPKVNEKQVKGLHILANYFFPHERSTLKMLGDMVNKMNPFRADLDINNIHPDYKNLFSRICVKESWTQPNTFTLYPLNSAACLLHYKVLLFLIDRLTENQHKSFYNQCSLGLKRNNANASSNQQDKNTALKRPLSQNESEKPSEGATPAKVAKPDTPATVTKPDAPATVTKLDIPRFSNVERKIIIYKKYMNCPFKDCQFEGGHVVSSIENHMEAVHTPHLFHSRFKTPNLTAEACYLRETALRKLALLIIGKSGKVTALLPYAMAVTDGSPTIEITGNSKLAIREMCKHTKFFKLPTQLKMVFPVTSLAHLLYFKVLVPILLTMSVMKRRLFFNICERLESTLEYKPYGSGVQCFMCDCLHKATHMKEHCMARHIPGVFKTPINERKASYAADALRELASLIVLGHDGVTIATVEDLQTFAQECMPLKWRDQPVGADERKDMAAVAKKLNVQYKPETVAGALNSPATLIHWRVMVFLLEHLSISAFNNFKKKYDEWNTLPPINDVEMPRSSIAALSVSSDKSAVQKTPATSKETSKAPSVAHLSTKKAGSSSMNKGEVIVLSDDDDGDDNKLVKVPCPMVGCKVESFDIQGHFCSHIPRLFTVHEPKYFQENASVMQRRVQGLKKLAVWILGPEGSLNGLVGLVNRLGKADKNLTVAVVTEAIANSMHNMCVHEHWAIPKTFSLDPLNSRAALIHYASLMILMPKLNATQITEFWKLYDLGKKPTKEELPNEKPATTSVQSPVKQSTALAQSSDEVKGRPGIIPPKELSELQTQPTVDVKKKDTEGKDTQSLTSIKTEKPSVKCETDANTKTKVEPGPIVSVPVSKQNSGNLSSTNQASHKVDTSGVPGNIPSSEKSFTFTGSFGEKTMCPISDCKQEILASEMRNHLLYTKHQNIYEFTNKDPPLHLTELANIKRVEGLECLSKWITGDSNARRLVDLLNKESCKPSKTSKKVEHVMRDMCKKSGWIAPKRFSSTIINCPAALITKRLLTFLKEKLSDWQLLTFMQDYSDVSNISEVEQTVKSRQETSKKMEETKQETEGTTAGEAKKEVPSAPAKSDQASDGLQVNQKDASNARLKSPDTDAVEGEGGFDYEDFEELVIDEAADSGDDMDETSDEPAEPVKKSDDDSALSVDSEEKSSALAASNNEMNEIKLEPKVLEEKDADDSNVKKPLTAGKEDMNVEPEQETGKKAFEEKLPVTNVVSSCTMETKEVNRELIESDKESGLGIDKRSDEKVNEAVSKEEEKNVTEFELLDDGQDMSEGDEYLVADELDQSSDEEMPDHYDDEYNDLIIVDEARESPPTAVEAKESWTSIMDTLLQDKEKDLHLEESTDLPVPEGTLEKTSADDPLGRPLKGLDTDCQPKLDSEDVEASSDTVDDKESKVENVDNPKCVKSEEEALQKTPEDHKMQGMQPGYEEVETPSSAVETLDVVTDVLPSIPDGTGQESNEDLASSTAIEPGTDSISIQADTNEDFSNLLDEVAKLSKDDDAKTSSEDEVHQKTMIGFDSHHPVYSNGDSGDDCSSVDTFLSARGCLDEGVTLKGVLVIQNLDLFPMFCNPTSNNWKIAVGVSPSKVETLSEKHWEVFEQVKSMPSVSIETGLDWTVPPSEYGKQEEVMNKVLEYCNSDKVLILRIRGPEGDASGAGAHAECLETVRDHCDKDQKILLHSFNGGPTQVRRWSKAFPEVHFGFSVTVDTFTDAQKEALRSIPQDKILIESDDVNGSYELNYFHDRLMHVAQKVGEIRDKSDEDIIQLTIENGERLFFTK